MIRESSQEASNGIEGKIKSGAIQLGARSDAGLIEFDMTSFTADTDRARKYVGLEGSTSASTRQQVNKNMLGADVLNVAKYPTATFAIESALHKKTKQGKPVVELKGEFTLHGKTRLLTLYAEPSQKDGQWNLRGDFTNKQTDFGITPYKELEFVDRICDFYSDADRELLLGRNALRIWKFPQSS